AAHVAAVSSQLCVVVSCCTRSMVGQLLGWLGCLFIYSLTFAVFVYITLSHLADTFVQSDVQGIEQSSYEQVSRESCMRSLRDSRVCEIDKKGNVRWRLGLF